MESVQVKNCVLDKEAVKRKLRRMSLQIAEQNADEKELVIAAINGNGEVVAGRLIDELKKVSTFKIDYIIIQMNKREPANVNLQPEKDLADKVILIVDDVANTGQTMLYALKPFIEQKQRKIQTLALVERSHKLFPVHTDYTGLSLATTLQEHISVETEGNEIMGAWLH